MSYGDDLDERFNALVAQFDEDEQRRMRDAASKAAKQHDKQAKQHHKRAKQYGKRAGKRAPRMSERRWKVWMAVVVVVAIVLASGAIVAVRPDLLSP